MDNQAGQGSSNQNSTPNSQGFVPQSPIPNQVGQQAFSTQTPSPVPQNTNPAPVVNQNWQNPGQFANPNPSPVENPTPSQFTSPAPYSAPVSPPQIDPAQVSQPFSQPAAMPEAPVSPASEATGMSSPSLEPQRVPPAPVDLNSAFQNSPAVPGSTASETPQAPTPFQDNYAQSSSPVAQPVVSESVTPPVSFSQPSFPAAAPVSTPPEATIVPSTNTEPSVSPVQDIPAPVVPPVVETPQAPVPPAPPISEPITSPAPTADPGPVAPEVVPPVVTDPTPPAPSVEEPKVETPEIREEMKSDSVFDSKPVEEKKVESSKPEVDSKDSKSKKDGGIGKSASKLAKNAPKAAPILVALVAVVFSFVFFSKYQMEAEKSKAAVAGVNTAAQSEDLAKQVASIVLLPDETPTVATVSDREKLSTEGFFAEAVNGDKVLIYSKANKAVLYRPSVGKVINVVALNSAALASESEEDEAEPTPEVTPTSAPTVAPTAPVVPTSAPTAVPQESPLP